jgi:hypothetical protein
LPVAGAAWISQSAKINSAPKRSNRSLCVSKIASTTDPILIQLIGTKDNMASPLDQVDIAVDAANLPSESRRYFYLEMRNTDHEHAVAFANTPEGA